MAKNNISVAFLVDSLSGGGAQKVFIRLASEFYKRGYRVSLLTFKKDGPNLENVPPSVPVVEISRVHFIMSTVKLLSYLRNSKCDVLISGLNYSNVISYLTSLFIKDVKFIRSQHSVFKGSSSMEADKLKKYRRKLFVKPLMRKVFKNSENIVAVSPGVKDDLMKYLDVDSRNIKVVYNPVLSDELLAKSRELVSHEWFESGKSVVLGVGRLSMAKDFKTLVKAFSIVNKHNNDTRLIILGDGEQRDELQLLINQLELRNKVCLPGFVNNPFKYMRNSKVFVLSSRWEGFGLVLAEAMACSTPVVSTDCQTGPADILENGRWGRLVPPNNSELMADAILKTLKEPIVPDERAKLFSVEKAADEYIKLFES